MEEAFVIDRIQSLIDEKFAGNVQAFSTALGIPPTSIRTTLIRKKNINVNILIAILRIFPELDMNYFFREEGSIQGVVMNQNSGIYRKSSLRLNEKSDIQQLIDFLKTNTIKLELSKS